MRKPALISWRFLETNKHSVVLLARPFGLLASTAAATPASLGSSTKHSWVKFKFPAKNKIQKIRENDGSYLFLQQFNKFQIWSKSNDRKWKLREFYETWLEKFVKSHQVNLFLAGF